MPALTPADLAHFAERGYLVLRGAFAADLPALRAEADRLLARADLIARKNLRCRWLPHTPSGEYRFECFDPVTDLSPLFLAYSRDPRLLAVLRAIYGGDACLRHDQLVYKPPGVGGYSLHQDFMDWPGYPRSFLTTVVALDRADAGNGCIRVYPCLHTNGHLTPGDGEYHELTPEMVAGTDPVDLELDAGDVAMFGCFLPHGSGVNPSPDRWRRHLFFCYNAAADGGDARAAHYAYYHDWVRQRYAAHGVADVYFE